jgi:hypothetical protein
MTMTTLALTFLHANIHPPVLYVVLLFPSVLGAATFGLFAWLISRQPAVLFSQNEPATSNQPVVLFSQNKPAPAISHQPNESTKQVRVELLL